MENLYINAEHKCQHEKCNKWRSMHYKTVTVIFQSAFKGLINHKNDDGFNCYEHYFNYIKQKYDAKITNIDEYYGKIWITLDK